MDPSKKVGTLSKTMCTGYLWNRKWGRGARESVCGGSDRLMGGG